MKLWSRIMQACGAAAATIVAALVVMVTYDVVARNVGAKSLPWIVEVTEYALPLSTFLAAPWLMFRYEHVRLDLLSNSLSARNRARIERFAAALCLAVSLTIAWYSVAVLVDTRKVGSLVIKSLVFPEWWLFVPVPFCFALLALECARRLAWPPPAAPPIEANADDGAEPNGGAGLVGGTQWAASGRRPDAS